MKRDAESWIDRFKDFFASDDCPTFVKAQVAKARRYADHPQEPVFEEVEEDDAVEAEDQPDWVGVHAGQNQIYEGVYMMMAGRIMTGAVPVLFFLKEKTQQSGFKKALKRMTNRRVEVRILIYLR